MTETIVNKTSVCEVIDTYNNGLMLNRLFDLYEDMLVVPQFEDGKRTFGNRSRIYKNDGPDAIGSIGVWNWTASPNNNDPDKDYVTSKYQAQVKLIRAVVLYGISSQEQLVSVLKQGFDSAMNDASHSNLLVLYKTNTQEYEGVYCPSGSLMVGADHKTYLNPEETVLGTVKIESADLLWAEQKAFYRFLDVDPKGTVLTAPLHDVVKQAVLSRTTWPAFNSFVGGTHNELNLFKAFLESISEDAAHVVAEKTGLSLDVASDHVNGFVLRANQFIDGSDINYMMLRGLIETNADIREQFELIAQERWERDYEQKLEEKKLQLDEVTKALEKMQASVNEQQQLMDAKKDEFDAWHLEATHIRNDFESSMQEKILSLEQNLGSVLADSVYFNQLGIQRKQDDSFGTQTKYVEGNEIETEETLTDYLDVQDLLIDNLKAAGVSEKYRNYIGAFLLSCLKSKDCIILAGPNGQEIVDAVSVTLYSRTAGIVKYDSRDYEVALQEILESEDRIICVDQVCRRGFVDELPAFLSAVNKPVFLLTPYAEDLCVEPAGLYNYALPLVTEAFVDARPTTEWIGGIAADNWLDFKFEGNREEFDKIDLLVKSELTKNTYLNALKLASQVSGEYARDGGLSYICAYLPYAYVTGRTSILLEDDGINSGIQPEISELVARLLGD